MEERLQKLMAQAGLGSRRACEELIAAGRVTVNGRTAVLGERADPQRDQIVVDGEPLRTAEQPVYIALYKPRGVISAVTGPDPRPTVRSLVDLPGRFYPVGRLDFDSEGLILLTNDGALANRLTHPRYGHEKEYRVLVASRPDDEQLNTWRRGVVLEDGYRTRPAVVRFEQPHGKGAWLRITLTEGRKRQIRETGAQIGLPVAKIIRIRIGGLTLGSLTPGAWRYLTPDEIHALTNPVAAASGKPARPPGARRTSDKPAARRPRTAPRETEKPRSPARGSAVSDAAPSRPSRAGAPGAKPSASRSRPPGGRRPAARPAAQSSGDVAGSSRSSAPGRAPRKKTTPR